MQSTPISLGRYTYHPSSNDNQAPLLLMNEDEQGTIKRVEFQTSGDIFLSNSNPEQSRFKIQLPYLFFQHSNTERKVSKEVIQSPRKIQDFDDYYLDLLAQKLAAKYKKPGRISYKDFKTDLLEVRYISQNLQKRLGNGYRQQPM